MAGNIYQDQNATAYNPLTRGGLESVRFRYPGVPSAENDQAALAALQREQAMGLAGDPGANPNGAPGQYAQSAPLDFGRLKELNDQSALMQGFASMRAVPTMGNLNPQPIGDNALTAFVRARNDAEAQRMQQQSQQKQAAIDLYNRHLEQSQNQGKQYADIAASKDQEMAGNALAAKQKIAETAAGVRAQALQMMLAMGQQKLAQQRDIAGTRAGIQQSRVDLARSNQGLRSSDTLANDGEMLAAIHEGSGAAGSAIDALNNPSGSQQIVNGVQDFFGNRVGSFAQEHIGDITQTPEIQSYNAHLSSRAGILSKNMINPENYRILPTDNADAAQKKMNAYLGELAPAMRGIQTHIANVSNNTYNPVATTPQPSHQKPTQPQVGGDPWAP